MHKPNLFIVGAAKAGTTTLHGVLANHPDVYMSPVKEPNFFSKDIDPENFRNSWKRRFSNDQAFRDSTGRIIPRHSWYVRDENEYLSLFSEAGSQSLVGEASVSYLYSKVAAQEIRAFSPDAKIIMILRNPVERAFSHFLMDVRTGCVTSEKDPVIAIKEDFMKPGRMWGRDHLYVDLGLYYNQVNRYLDCFPREQVQIHLFDNFKENPDKVSSSILSFLGLSNGKSVHISKTENGAKYPKNRVSSMLLRNNSLKRSVARVIPQRWKQSAKAMLLSEAAVPRLQESQRVELMNLFRNDISRLENLIHEDLSIWRQ